MQDTLVAGETLNFLAITTDYPASAGWVVTLYLNPRAGGTATSVTGTASGDDHLLQVSAATTAGWAPGAWAWDTWAAKGSERYRLEAGQLQVQAGLIGAAAGLDTRSQAQRALDDAEAALAAWTPTTKRYRINGREARAREGEVIKRRLAALCERAGARADIDQIGLGILARLDALPARRGPLGPNALIRRRLDRARGQRGVDEPSPDGFQELRDEDFGLQLAHAAAEAEQARAAAKLPGRDLAELAAKGG